MGKTRWELTVAENQPWRSAVPHHRLRPPPKIKLRNPLPGQMLLPGMEAGEEACLLACEAPLPVEEAEGQDQRAAVQHSDLTCPNCGGVEFDDDGDCTGCWEPGVARRARRS
jgi:hypothetical protein